MSSNVEKVVQEKYGQVAKSGLSSAHGGVRSVAEAFGYSADELNSIPAEANMGLSCGNPTAFASLRPGEVLLISAPAAGSMRSSRPRRSGRRARPSAST